MESIHQKGGTILGTSRGPVDIGRAVENLMRVGVKILFAVGGDGTVEGTAGDDLIDANYTGDPEGDMVDNDDALLPGAVGNDMPVQVLIGSNWRSDIINAFQAGTTARALTGAPVIAGEKWIATKWLREGEFA